MNDAKSTSCKFSGEIVPYMYGEMASRESSAFESHLLECSECTDEFAAVSSARYEVYDWKKLEFDPLATPVIRIPQTEETTISIGLFDKVRTILAHSWTIPAVGFAALIAVSIFGASVLLKSDDGKVIVSNGASKDPANTRVTTAPVVPAVGRTDEGTHEIVSPKVTKVSAPQHLVERNRGIREVKSTRIPEPKSTTAQNPKRNVPTLNEFGDDEEDNSLRLAELFEDVETSD